MKKIIFIPIGLVAIIAALFLYKELTKSSTKVLETAKVSRGNIRGIVVETGVIKPQVGALVKIGAQATGTIMAMNVKIGDRVRKGQLIALIDDREIQKVIEQQKASLASAENTLKQIEETYPERIREAKANYEYARLTYEREAELIKREYTTRDAVDRARSLAEASEANLKRLQSEYGTQMKIARANIEDIAAQLRQQETRLSYTRIYSPIDGVVSDVTVQKGETIVAGLQVANLVSVLDPKLLEMWIYVDETDIGKVTTGQRVEYSVDTFPDKIFHGVIEKVYPQPVVKENIVYYLAIVKIAPEDTSVLKPEMTTHIKIIVSEKQNILTVPNAAVKFEKGKQVAYKVINPDSVQQVEIRTGVRGEDNTEIISGVSEGDVVATKVILPVASKQESR